MRGEDADHGGGFVCTLTYKMDFDDCMIFPYDTYDMIWEFIDLRCVGCVSCGLVSWVSFAVKKRAGRFAMYIMMRVDRLCAHVVGWGGAGLVL